MSILIKGVDMPTDKKIAVVIYPDGMAYATEMFAGVCKDYIADCTAEQLPPHSRLTEAEGNSDG